ncbi:MAG: O-antigen ligase family protein [Myxococcota bacterium]
MRVLAAIAIVAFPYIALEIAVPVGAWDMNAPVADLAAAALLPLALVLARVPPPGPVGYAVLLAAFVAGLPGALSPAESAHFLVRKPLFLWLAYGVGLAGVIARASDVRWLRRALLAAVALASAISIGSSLARIAAGNATWFAAIEGLTNNHKTLAVALAPTLPLLWGMRRGRVDLAVIGGAAVAIALSMSRTSWIAAAAGLSFLVPFRGRPLSDRPGLVVGIVVAGALAAIYGPVLSGSITQLDAARSRHSLDERALEMFLRHPIVGAGGGSNVRWEMLTFPHYRVNGVDAHGVVQKVASEAGLVGLAGYAAFVLAAARRVWATGDAALKATFVALHVNLLFSTETFSQTHWCVYATVWGLSSRHQASGYRLQPGSEASDAAVEGTAVAASVGKRGEAGVSPAPRRGALPLLKPEARSLKPSPPDGGDP